MQTYSPNSCNLYIKHFKRLAIVNRKNVVILHDKTKATFSVNHAWKKIRFLEVCSVLSTVLTRLCTKML